MAQLREILCQITWGKSGQMKIEIKVRLLSDMDYTGVILDRFFCVIIVLMSIYNYQLCLNKVC